MICWLSRRTTDTTRRKALAVAALFVLALGCMGFPSPAFSQSQGAFCRDTNRTVFPYYQTYANNQVYICDGSQFQTLLTTTASPLSIDFLGTVGIGTAAPTAGLDVYINGATSTPAERLDGTWYSGGSSTTTKPQLLIEPAGTTSTSWSTSGTGIGVNAVSGFGGNFLDIQSGGTSKLTVDAAGDLVSQGYLASQGVYSLYYQGASNNNTIFGIRTAGYDYDFQDSTGAIHLVRIKSNGYVGIGTTSPAAGLDVATNGAASAPGLRLDGTWYGGGTATTSKPQLLIEPAGTTSTNWVSSGTGLGINAPSGFGGNLIDIKSNNSSDFIIDNLGHMTIRDGGQGYGSPTILTVVPSNDSTLAASTEDTDINFNLARNVQFSTGNITTQRAFRIQAPTYSFVGASTITNAATVDISGPPIAGSNATITNPAALVVESGNVGIGTTTPQATLDVNGYLRLAKNSSQPVACSSTNDGAIALTHLYTLCICEGGSTSWVQESNGTTACSW